MTDHKLITRCKDCINCKSVPNCKYFCKEYRKPCVDIRKCKLEEDG